MAFVSSATQYYEWDSAPSPPLTIMQWVYITSKADEGEIFSIGSHEGIGACNCVGYDSGTSTNFFLWNGSGTSEGGVATLNTWIHYAMTVVSYTAGSALLGYRNGALDITFTNTTTPEGNYLAIGNIFHGTQPMIGRIAGFKMWDVVLTLAEIQNEMMQYLPHRTANLVLFNPFTNIEAVDYSGNGAAIAQILTPALADGPPIPWKRARTKIYVPIISGTPVSQTMAGTIESLAALTPTRVGIIEAIAPVSVTKANSYEGLLSASQARIGSLEAAATPILSAAGIHEATAPTSSGSRSGLHESTVPVSQTRSGIHEGLLSASQTRASYHEATAPISQTRQGIFEGALTVSNTFAGLHEATGQLPITQTFASLHEGLLPVSQTRTGTVEAVYSPSCIWLSWFGYDGEACLSLVLDDTAGIEWADQRHLLGSDRRLQAVAPGTPVSRDMAGLIEALAIISQTRTSPYEATKPILVTLSSSAHEALANLLQTRTGIYSALGSVTQTRAGIFEGLLTVTEPRIGIHEALSAVLPVLQWFEGLHEAKGYIFQTRTAAYEATAPILKTRTGALEALQGILAPKTSLHEALSELLAVSRQMVGILEALGIITSTPRAGIQEARQGIKMPMVGIHEAQVGPDVPRILADITVTLKIVRDILIQLKK